MVTEIEWEYRQIVGPRLKASELGSLPQIPTKLRVKRRRKKRKKLTKVKSKSISEIRAILQRGTAFTRLLESQKAEGSEVVWSGSEAKRREKKKRRKELNKRRSQQKIWITQALIRLGYADYETYLVSRHWKAKRLSAFHHYGEKCNRCGSILNLAVHHKSYKNLGNELMSDLEILCKICHDKHHHRR